MFSDGLIVPATNSEHVKSLRFISLMHSSGIPISDTSRNGTSSVQCQSQSGPGNQIEDSDRAVAFISLEGMSAGFSFPGSVSKTLEEPGS